MERGLSLDLARQVAVELTARDALAAHAEIELGIDLTDQVNPWETAGASALLSLLGGVLSLLAILLPPAAVRIEVCVAVVLVTLSGTGFPAARFGAAPTGRAAARNLAVGGLTMAVTDALGALAENLLCSDQRHRPSRLPAGGPSQPRPGPAAALTPTTPGPGGCPRRGD